MLPAERLNDSGAFKVLCESNADLDILNKAGKQPLGQADALKELRYSTRHKAARKKVSKLAFERRMCATDVRYLTQKLHI